VLATPDGQPVGEIVVTIVDDDCAVEFAAGTAEVDEDGGVVETRGPSRRLDLETGGGRFRDRFGGGHPGRGLRIGHRDADVPGEPVRGPHQRHGRGRIPRRRDQPGCHRPDPQRRRGGARRDFHRHSRQPAPRQRPTDDPVRHRRQPHPGRRHHPRQRGARPRRRPVPTRPRGRRPGSGSGPASRRQGPRRRRFRHLRWHRPPPARPVARRRDRRSEFQPRTRFRRSGAGGRRGGGGSHRRGGGVPVRRWHRPGVPGPARA
jgi:hypothetical protein